MKCVVCNGMGGMGERERESLFAVCIVFPALKLRQGTIIQVSGSDKME